MRSAKEQDIISNSKHCINAMTSYQFRVIVGLSTLSHCINFELLQQFRVIVSISSHCINFESLDQFRVIVSVFYQIQIDIVLFFQIFYSYRNIDPRHHIHFKKAHISRFSLAIEKKQKKNLSIYLTLKTDSTLSIFSRHAKARKKKENWKLIFFFIHIVYVRVKSPWMQKQNKRANERSAASE